MPSIICSCGYRFGIGSFPNRNAYLAVSQQDFDDLGDLESFDRLSQLLFTSTRMYQCAKCSELIVFWKGKTEAEFFKKH
jgi:hypothetical protein